MDHVKAINSLMDDSGLERISSKMIKDLCLVAIRPDGKVVGFIWAMVSQSKEMSYVDYFAVDKEHRGLSVRLIKAMISEAFEMGIKRVFSMIPDNGSLDSLSAFKINCAIGLMPRQTKYHLFDSKVESLGGLWANRENKKTLTP